MAIQTIYLKHEFHKKRVLTRTKHWLWYHWLSMH